MDSAFERFLARRGARAGLAILFVLFTLSAWAPFVANDRPYVLVASDARGAQRARTEIVPLSASVAASVRAGAPADAEDVRALRERLDALDEAGAADVAAPVRSALEGALGAAPAAADDLESAARAARAALASRALEPPTRRTFPLFAELDRYDVLAALAPFSLLLALRVRRVLGIGAALLLAFAPALLVASIVGLVREERPLAASGAIKDAVARGALVVERAWFPPIPFGVAETNLAEAWSPPSWSAAPPAAADGVPAARAKPFEPAVGSRARHVLGTDGLGRDVAARVLWGGRRSLAIATFAAALLFVVGTALGAAAGYLGGFVDAAISRTIEVVLCFPAFFLVLCAVAWTDPRVVPVQLAVALVIAAVGWTTTARLVRAEALRVATSGHVLAARALGLHPLRILCLHVVPNATAPGVVAFGFAAGGAIGVESSLAFLGLGAEAAVPTWGALVGAARGADQAWAWIPPGACVFLAVVAWVLVAEAARAELEPRRGGGTA